VFPAFWVALDKTKEHLRVAALRCVRETCTAKIRVAELILYAAEEDELS